MYGLYQHKRSFGGRWVELTGAHERVSGAGGTARGGSPAGVARGGPAMTEPADHRRAPGRGRADAAAPARRPHRPAHGCRPAARRAARRPRDRPAPAWPRSPVRGVTDDSREVRPGALFVAVAGAPRRRPRVRGGGGRGRRRGGHRRAPAPEVALPQLVVDRQPAGARRRGRLVVRRPEPRAGGRRDHRHGRQDDDLVPRRRGARGGRHPDRDDRHGRDRGSAASRRANAEHATTPEAPELQAALRRDGRRPATARPSSRRRRTGWRSTGSTASPTTSRS